MISLVNKQYEEVKIRAKEMLDKAKEEFNTLDPEDVPEFHEVSVLCTTVCPFISGK